MIIGHLSGETATAFAGDHVSAAEAFVITYYVGDCLSKSTWEGAIVTPCLSEEAATEKSSRNGPHGQIRVGRLNAFVGGKKPGENGTLDKTRKVLLSESVLARRLKMEIKLITHITC